MQKNRQIAVIGAGLMGHGIALTMARANQYVHIADPDEASRATVAQRMSDSLKTLGETADRIPKILKKIEISGSTPVAVKDADFVFEAAPEKLDLKRKIFADIEEHAPDHCVLASNTSVMPITKIMANLRLKGRALGTHWWNPPHLIPLVEVVGTKLEDVEDNSSGRIGMARPVLHQSVCVPHPDRLRTAIHIGVQSCNDLCLRYQACTNMPRVQILSMPHSAPVGSNAPLHVPRPDALQCKTAATSQGH